MSGDDSGDKKLIMDLLKRKLLKTVPSTVLLSGCLSIGSPSQGIIKIKNESDNQHKTQITVQNPADKTVISKSFSIETSHSKTVQFTLNEKPKYDVEMSFDRNIEEIIHGETDENRWQVKGGKLYGAVRYSSSDQIYEIAIINQGTVRVTRKATGVP